jgi:hypothetical protein
MGKCPYCCPTFSLPGEDNPALTAKTMMRDPLQADLAGNLAAFADTDGAARRS